MRRLTHSLLLLALLSAGFACARRDSARHAATTNSALPDVPLPAIDAAVDSGATTAESDEAADANCLEQGDEFYPTCRATLTVGPDTLVLPTLWVHESMISVGDSLFIGIASGDSGRSWSLAQVTFKSGAVQWLRVPPGADIAPGTFAISGDGHYVAYFIYRADTAMGLLQTWPDLAPIARTAQVAVGGTDMPTSAVRFGRDSVEFYFQTEALAWDRWMRYRSQISNPGWVVDTIVLRGH